MSGPVTNNGRPAVRSRRLYYAGTDTLEIGYNLCFKHDASVGASDAKNEKGVEVTKPATANLMLYAGVVQKKMTGPGWVEVAVPDRKVVLQAFTDANMTKEVTILGPQDGSYALAAKTAATTPPGDLDDVALALETVDTDTTNANKAVIFI